MTTRKLTYLKRAFDDDLELLCLNRLYQIHKCCGSRCQIDRLGGYLPIRNQDTRSSWSPHPQTR